MPEAARAPDADEEQSRVHRLLLLAITAAVLLLALYLLAVHTRWGQRLDDAAFDGRTARASVLRATGRLLDTISVGSLAFLGAVILGVAVVRRRVSLALTAGVVVLGANVTTQVLKELVLGRTDLVPPPDILGPSFPSGHTTVAMSLALALVLVVPARLRTFAALLGLIYACMVGTGTVTAGWHRPSDVMGGFLVVTMWGAGATALLVWSRGTTEEPEDLDDAGPIISPAFAYVGAGLLGIAFLGFAGAFIAIRQERLDAVRLGGAYVASLAAIAGVGLVGMAGFLAAIHGAALDPLPSERAP